MDRPADAQDPKPLVFRLHDGTPNLVREVLVEKGWEEFDELQQDEEDWNFYWRASAFRSSDYEKVKPWQRLNHHPRSVCIARKDWLARNLKRMRGTFGSALYNFSPMAFNLPNDYVRFLDEYSKNRVTNGRGPYWICKPVDLSRGRGIFIFEDAKKLIYDGSVIVQRYISNPLLVSGYKFDLRIYVCVKSFSPLTIYMYQEGLVRFATEKFNLNDLDNLFSHLTNTSINKFGPFYSADKEHIGQGCKWTLSKFRCFLHSLGVNEILLWQRINNIVTLTLLSIAPSIPAISNCLELFGFDILIDENLKPWLLEVNYSPALSLDCSADFTVKKELINDFVDLLNYKETDSLRQKGYLTQKYRPPRYLGAPSRLASTHQGLLRPRVRTELSCCKKTVSKSCFCGRGTHNLQSSNAVPKRRHHSNDNLNHTLQRTLGSSFGSATCYCHKGTLFSYVLPTAEPLDSSKTLNIESEDEEDLCLSAADSVKDSGETLKLPPINEEHSRKALFSWSYKIQNKRMPPPNRVGDFILTFPFNEVTAAQKKLNLKVAIQEVHKLTSQIMANGRDPNAKQKKEKKMIVNSGGEEKLNPLFWGPKSPPPLRECLKT